MDIDYTVWATLALMHIVAVVSPGPDFAIVLKQSLQKGLRPALWTSFGVGTAILLHVFYSIVGISLVIKTTPWLFQFLLYIAAAYFIWMGISALSSKPSTPDKNEISNTTKGIKSTWYKAFGIGFLTNGLNPKATLFFLALYTVAIPAETTIATKSFYGVYFAIVTGIWFCILSYMTNFKRIRMAYQSHGHWFDRIMGIVLIIMAIVLLWQ